MHDQVETSSNCVWALSRLSFTFLTSGVLSILSLNPVPPTTGISCGCGPSAMLLWHLHLACVETAPLFLFVCGVRENYV